MSKQLPYYQFEVAEYLAGDIMLCSLEAQGLFTVIKCLYWQKECLLHVGKVVKRFPDSIDLIDELKDENCIKVNKKGFIEISFLINQYNQISKKKQILSEAGKAGRQKQLQAKSGGGLGVAQPTPGHLDKIREDKRKEEEIRGDIITPSVEDFKSYADERGYSHHIAEKAWHNYENAGWKDSKDKEIKNWKNKLNNVWFKEDHKLKKQEFFPGTKIPKGDFKL